MPVTKIYTCDSIYADVIKHHHYVYRSITYAPLSLSAEAQNKAQNKAPTQARVQARGQKVLVVWEPQEAEGSTLEPGPPEQGTPLLDAGSLE